MPNRKKQRENRKRKRCAEGLKSKVRHEKDLRQLELKHSDELKAQEKRLQAEMADLQKAARPAARPATTSLPRLPKIMDSDLSDQPLGPRILGAGRFGKVFLKTLKSVNNSLVAVKVVPATTQCKDDLVQEADFLSRVCHRPWFPSLFGWNLDVAQPYLVQEFVSCRPGVDTATTLLDAINEPATLLIKSWEYGRALLQVAHGIHYLHLADVLHNDLKSDNVMVQRNGDNLSAKIIDFGLACAVDRPIQLDIKAGEKVSKHIAPEVATGGPVSVHSDVYSLGRMIEDVGKCSGSGNSGRHLKTVARACLKTSPTNRLTILQLVNKLQT
ncbi:tyrosine-protein kinase Yes-like [Branchiostoma floridae x Branchiostoma belcheri]